MTRSEAYEGSKLISDFEPAIDELCNAINRLSGVVDLNELSEMELNETEQLRILCESYLERLQELEEREGESE